MVRRGLVTLLKLPFWYLVAVGNLWLFFAVTRVSLQCLWCHDHVHLLCSLKQRRTTSSAVPLCMKFVSAVVFVSSNIGPL